MVLKGYPYRGGVTEVLLLGGGVGGGGFSSGGGLKLVVSCWKC